MLDGGIAYRRVWHITKHGQSWASSLKAKSGPLGLMCPRYPWDEVVYSLGSLDHPLAQIIASHRKSAPNFRDFSIQITEDKRKWPNFGGGGGGQVSPFWKASIALAECKVTFYTPRWPRCSFCERQRNESHRITEVYTNWLYLRLIIYSFDHIICCSAGNKVLGRQYS